MEKEFYELQEFSCTKPWSYPIHSYHLYTILFIKQGKCNLQWENKDFLCSTEDIILIKPDTKVKLLYSIKKYPLQLFCLKLYPSLLKELSKNNTDLKQSFDTIPFSFFSVRIQPKTSMLIKNLLQKLLSIQEEKDTFANELFKNSLLTMLLILILRSCIDTRSYKQSKDKNHLLIDDLFVYIREHITEELTLEKLEQVFFVNRSYICRQFKMQTGQTIHHYIIKLKLDICCHYIEEGYSIKDVYQLAGFGGYNHFFRAFKQEYGITPKQYFKKMNCKEINSAEKNCNIN